MNVTNPPRRLAGLLSRSSSITLADIASQLHCDEAEAERHLRTLEGLGVRLQRADNGGLRLAEPLELLSEGAIYNALDSARQTLEGLVILPAVDSTHAEMLRWPPKQRHARALLAETQTGGQGRNGRRWQSPFARHLYLNLGWRLHRPMAGLACLPLVVALAAAGAVEGFGVTGLAIKWPNDLLLKGAKLGGCLVELKGEPPGPCDAVMGVGINVRWPEGGPPGDAGLHWADLAAAPRPVSRNALAAAVLDELVSALQEFEQHGFAPFRQRWAEHDALLGQHVRLYRGGEMVTGIARGLGESGGLLLEGRDGRREFHAGEVTSHIPEQAEQAL